MLGRGGEGPVFRGIFRCYCGGTHWLRTPRRPTHGPMHSHALACAWTNLWEG